MAAPRTKPTRKLDDAGWLDTHATRIVNKKTGEVKISLNKSGALDLGFDQGLCKIDTTMIVEPTEHNGHVARFKATVTTSKGEFSAHGSANPSTTEVTLVRRRVDNPPIPTKAITEMAETRAIIRALGLATNNGNLASDLTGDPATEAGDTIEDEERPAQPARPAPATAEQQSPQEEFAQALEEWDRTAFAPPNAEVEWVEPGPKSPSPPTQIRPPDDSPASAGQRLAIKRAADQLNDPIDDAQLDQLTDGAARELLTQLQQMIVERRRADQASKRAAASR